MQAELQGLLCHWPLQQALVIAESKDACLGLYWGLHSARGMHAVCGRIAA